MCRAGLRVPGHVGHRSVRECDVLDGDPAEPGLSDRRPDQTEQQADRGGLARPVGSQEAEDFAPGDLKVEIV